MTTKFKVYTPNNTCVDTTVYFKTEQDIGNISLIACDKEGKTLPGGYILKIRSDGKLYLNTGISKELGLMLGNERQIKINSEYL